MRIGIDISQIVHEGTGVGTYVRNLTKALLRGDQKNEYILFGASLRKLFRFRQFVDGIAPYNPRVRLVAIPFPPTFLDFLWNRLHVAPIEWFIGPVEVFISSDWTQPPLRAAKGVTTIHDLIALKFPAETDAAIVSAHTRRLEWVKKECQVILCDSMATKKDGEKLLSISGARMHVVYPGN